MLASEQRATEEILRSSGLSYTILRNGWYIENYTAQIAQYLEHGAIVTATHGALVSAATRNDFAKAAAAVLINDTHEDSTYELGGTAFTMADLATAVSEVAGKHVESKDVDLATLTGILQSAGLDSATAGFVASFDEATARGDLFTTSDDLARLIGRPTTPLITAVRASI